MLFVPPFSGELLSLRRLRKLHWKNLRVPAESQYILDEIAKFIIDHGREVDAMRLIRYLNTSSLVANLSSLTLLVTRNVLFYTPKRRAYHTHKTIATWKQYFGVRSGTNSTKWWRRFSDWNYALLIYGAIDKPNCRGAERMWYQWYHDLALFRKEPRRHLQR